MIAKNKDIFEEEHKSSKKEKYDFFPFVDGEKLIKRSEIDRKVQNED